MTFRPAKLSELTEILDKYYALARDIAGSDNDAHWTVGFYPDEALLKEHIENGNLYVLEDDDIVGAAVLNRECIDDYSKVSWKSPEPAYFIHLFASFNRGKGNGKKLFENLKERAKELGAASIRLDTIEGNDRAVAFYTSCGFDFLGKHKLDYDATEIEDFGVFEYAL